MSKPITDTSKLRQLIDLTAKIARQNVTQLEEVVRWHDLYWQLELPKRDAKGHFLKKSVTEKDS